MMNTTPFLDSFFEQIEKVGIDISGLNLDHIAYQASTFDDYENMKLEFESLGKVVSEEIIGGRRVLVIKLFNPIDYKDNIVNALELIEPKPEQDLQSDFQHAEFIYSAPFEELIEKYPNINWDTSSMNRAEFAHLKINFENGLTLKFLHGPILEMFENKAN